MSDPRILLLYTPAGGGHRAAARAVAEQLTRTGSARVEVRDVLEFAPRWFAYDRAWNLLQRRGVRVWDWLFDVTERGHIDLDPVRLPLHAAVFERLDRYLLTTRPTHIVCTHYLPALAVARVKPRLDARTIITITDHLDHRAWIVRGIDAYCVADHRVAQRVRARTAAEVHVTGIPIANAANRPVRAIGATGERVLALLGGVPRADAIEAIDQLATLPTWYQLQVLVGDGHAVATHAQRRLPHAEVAARADGLLDAIDAADLVITKAGGLTVSECLARGRAMVLPFLASGQERGNLFHALDAGAAVHPALGELGDVVGELLASPGRLRRMSAKARIASHPDSAAAVARVLFADRYGEVRDAA